VVIDPVIVMKLYNYKKVTLGPTDHFIVLIVEPVRLC